VIIVYLEWLSLNLQIEKLKVLIYSYRLRVVCFLTFKKLCFSLLIRRSITLVTLLLVYHSKRDSWNNGVCREENFAVVKNHKYFHLRRIKFCGESYERRAM